MVKSTAGYPLTPALQNPYPLGVGVLEGSRGFGGQG